MRKFWGLVHEAGVKSLPMMVTGIFAVVMSLAGASNGRVGTMIGLMTVFGVAAIFGGVE